MPGRPPMCKLEFATVLRAQSSQITLKIHGTNEIQEIKVVGDWAFMWSKRRVVATPPDCSPTLERAAHTLIVLKKERARWVLARNANLFAPVQRPQLHDQP